MNLLINKSDFAKYNMVSKGVESSRLDTFIGEAQFIDLKCAIGDALYYDVLSNINNPDYQNLIKGSTFTASDGIEKEQYGLKAVLVYFSWSRYILKSAVVDTSFSVVQKTNTWSEPIGQSTKRDIRDESRQIAFKHWEIVKEYLEVSNFPAWRKLGCSKKSNKNCKTKITVLN